LSVPEDARPGPRGRGRPLAALLAAGVAILAVLLAGRQAGGVVLRFAEWVEALGPWGAAAFVAGYAALVVALVPGSLLTLAAGALFGLVRGTLLVLLAATLGATAAFLVARSAARGAVERRIGGDPRVAALDRAVGESGWWLVLLLRLSPVVPFNLLNYALGLTRVRLRDYVLASIGMLPGTMLYVYAGTLVRDLAALGAGVPRVRGTGYWLVVGLGLLATLAVTVLLARTARRALSRATAGGV